MENNILEHKPNKLSQAQLNSMSSELVSLFSAYAELLKMPPETIENKHGKTLVAAMKQLIPSLRRFIETYKGEINQDVYEELGRGLLRLIAQVKLSLGRQMVKDGSWQEGLETLQSAFEVFRKIGNLDGMARAYIEIGVVQELFGDYEVAKLSFRDAERLFKKTKREDGIAVAELQLGTLALDYYDYEQARPHLKFASSFFHQHGDKQRAELSDGLLNLADEYERDLAMV